MKSNGFSFKKGCFYRIESDMAFCVNVEMPTGMVYANCFVLPLYVPADQIYMTYGTRLTPGAASQSDGEDNSAELAGKLASILAEDIFPQFQTITSPSVFFDQVKHRKLFALYCCRISEVFVQRLRLATAFYERQYFEIPKICSEYAEILERAPYMTSGCKKIYLDEIQLFRDAMALNAPERDSVMVDIIKATKRACFSL